MLKVFFTVDVEVWIGGWDRLDERFPDAFRRHIYGHTRTGDWGLPRKLAILNDHGLKGVFFVEPLFALRFGMAPLQEIVGLIREAGQEIQLHLHPEWIDEAFEPILPHIGHKRRLMREFTQDEQVVLLREAQRLLAGAGAFDVSAFRAGSFGMNFATLEAVGKVGLAIDSSYNALLSFSEPEFRRFGLAHQPFQTDTVLEYPMTVYRDGSGQLRHLQLTACSAVETESVLRKAMAANWKTVVMLSHSFELLNQKRNAAEPIVVQRFLRLARFLSRHADYLQTAGFRGLEPEPVVVQPPLIRSGLGSFMGRSAEQLWCRLRGLSSSE